MFEVVQHVGIGILLHHQRGRGVAEVISHYGARPEVVLRKLAAEAGLI
jgi:hypothetical protein